MRKNGHKFDCVQFSVCFHFIFQNCIDCFIHSPFGQLSVYYVKHSDNAFPLLSFSLTHTNHFDFSILIYRKNIRSNKKVIKFYRIPTLLHRRHNLLPFPKWYNFHGCLFWWLKKKIAVDSVTWCVCLHVIELNHNHHKKKNINSTRTANNKIERVHVHAPPSKITQTHLSL